MRSPRHIRKNMNSTALHKRLIERELSSRSNAAFKKHKNVDKFRNFRLLGGLDIVNEDAARNLSPTLRKRTRVTEIISTKDIVFGLTSSGLCAAFQRTSQKLLCYVNVHDEIIRSLFYNELNECLITVSVRSDDNYSSLRCRSTPLAWIKTGRPEAGISLFESEHLKWPGFVEFDNVNSKILTYSSLAQLYKVWSMSTYEFLYSIPDDDIAEVKISPGIMLLVHHRVGSHMQLEIRSIDDGSLVQTFSHMIHRRRKVDFIEQFNEKLLVKQENENLQILDVRSATLTEVSRTRFHTPSAFVFLYESQLFITFRHQGAAVWNFKGQLVTRFEDLTLMHCDCNMNNIYITSRQDLVVSYCKDKSHRGALHVSNIQTGKCVARIHAIDAEGTFDPKAEEALQNVTSVYYNEDRNEIYTGSHTGVIHVWSN
eukprot:GILK01008284.1.p1 GENE.GILK01008284.1~~GILK01008284.1.p1  ORF type:complete len:427 (+),score=50.12 GILK01008284.1:82-1362(+)